MMSARQQGLKDCPVPLSFAGRLFVLESADSQPAITVFTTHEGQPLFEVKQNHPVENPGSIVHVAEDGSISVVDRESGETLYVIHPGDGQAVVSLEGVRGDPVEAEVSAEGTRVVRVVGGDRLPEAEVDHASCLLIGTGIQVDREGAVAAGIIQRPPALVAETPPPLHP